MEQPLLSLISDVEMEEMGDWFNSMEDEEELYELSNNVNKNDSNVGGGACSSSSSKVRMKEEEEIRRRSRKSNSKSQEHILAERKRRLDLTQKFIALSATIPGLKKIDKATVLKEATTYVKQLQNRIRELEEESENEKKKKSIFPSVEPTTSFSADVILPELKVRLFGNQVLIRIQCHKQNDAVFLKILKHITTLHLSPVTYSLLPIANFALDITIIAQMGDNYNTTLDDLVKCLTQAILQFTSNSL